MTQLKKVFSRTAVVVALITVLGTIIVAVVGNLNKPSPDNDSGSKQYVGRILDNATQLPISNAKVTLDLPGMIPQITYTDNEGTYFFNLALKQEQLNGLISVNATGYKNYSRSINLSASLLNIGDIRLFPVSISETPTNTAEPTFTATWTPMPSLTPSVAKTIFEDTFVDNRNSWYVDSPFPNIVAGKYTHKISCPTLNASFYCQSYVIKIPFAFPKNFRMEIDATLLESSSNAHMAIGFQVRRKDTSNYYYINYFIPQRLYQFSLSYNGSPFSIIPDTTSNFINRELGATNRFGIEIKDSLVTPVINGQKINQVEDGNLANAGGGYLTILVGKGETAKLQFDNLTVEEVR